MMCVNSIQSSLIKINSLKREYSMICQRIGHAIKQTFINLQKHTYH